MIKLFPKIIVPKYWCIHIAEHSWNNNVLGVDLFRKLISGVGYSRAERTLEDCIWYALVSMFSLYCYRKRFLVDRLIGVSLSNQLTPFLLLFITEVSFGWDFRLKCLDYPYSFMLVNINKRVSIPKEIRQIY